MASNTQILIKRSEANNTPGILNSGELAYSYASNTLFIGTPGSDGYVEIGHYSNLTNLIAGTYGDATNIPILTVDSHGTVTNVTTSAISTTLGLSSDNGTNTMSLLTGTLSVVGDKGIVTSIETNTSTITVSTDDTVVRSNTESVGPQHIQTDVSISGNLTVQGTTTYVQTAINQTDDSLIELAANNTVGDVLDIGFYGKHEGTDGTVVTGLVRNAGTSDFYLFDNINIGDQENLTSNLITQASLSANGASLYASQFLASEGVGSTGGFSFNLDGGLDTGMFSPADGELAFYSNSDKIFTANTSAFTVNYPSVFNNTVNITTNSQIQYHNGDNTDAVYFNNNGSIGNTRFIIGDTNLEQEIVAIESNSSTSATTVWLENATDIRDSETGESLIVKGEQKYGVVTQFLVNGNDPVTEKVVIDPLVPPAVGDMQIIDLGNDQDDAFVDITSYFPFDVTFNGQTYGPTGAGGGVYVGSNGYITFGSGSDNNSHEFPPVATNPGYPAIVVGLGDISYQRVYTYFHSASNTFRVRYEGDTEFSNRHIGSSSSLIWEVVFYGNTAGKFDIRIVRMNNTAQGGVDGRWNTYLTDGSNFLDTRSDRTIPWTTYTQFAKQLTNGTNTVELLEDGTLKLPNGTTLSDADSGLFIDPIREDGTSTDILYYNTTTKEVTYGTLADIRADVLSNGIFSWTISSVDGSLTSNVGTSIGASANSVVIGQNVDTVSGVEGRVAIGDGAGQTSQGWKSVAIGMGAGNANQNDWSVAVGLNAGNLNQSNSSTAVGHGAGYNYQGSDSVAVGVMAAKESQGYNSTAVGNRAARNNQGNYAVAVGNNAGYEHQGNGGVAIGDYAGNYYQSTDGIAIGTYAQENSSSGNGWAPIAIGRYAGREYAGSQSVAIGNNAGNNGLGYHAVAIGHYAASNGSGDHAIAIGDNTGSEAGLGSITMGFEAGYRASQYSVAIGYQAGWYDSSPLGLYQIAIGAYAAQNYGQDNSIVLNASGSDLSPRSSGFFVNPVAYTATQDAVNDGLMFYNQDTKEIRYSYTLDGGSF